MTLLAGRIVRGSTSMVLSFSATVAVSFFLMPFMVQSLGDRLYGFWTLVATFVGCYGLLDLGLSSAVNRHIAAAIGGRDTEQCNRIFNTGLLLFSALGFVALLVSGLLAGLASVIFDNPKEASIFWKVILILGANMAVSFPRRVFSGILMAELRHDIISVIELLSLTLRTILIVGVLLAGYKLVALAWVILISDLPQLFLYPYFAKRTVPTLRFDSVYWERGAAKALFSYSFFAFIYQLGDGLRFNIDAFVVSAFVGLSAVTHYKIASMMAMYFISLLVRIVSVLQPLFSRQDSAGEQIALQRTLFFGMRVSIWLTSFISFGLITWGKPFIQRWMGPEYLDAYPCLVILVLGCTFALWQNVSLQAVFGIAKHRTLALQNCIEGGCNLLLSLLLVRDFGLIGVALGTFIPMTVIKLLVQPIYVCRVISIRYSEYIRTLIRSLVRVAFALIVPVLISISYAAPNYPSLFLVALASGCVYFFTMWFIEFGPEEKQILQRAILPKLSMKKADL